ncbi:Hypothetical protein R9X50_00462400 [Acrodontium crateriforme]|uniref:RNI-like protein n=1 Tax=Acrodontium crateriforme TaxID=150365 RepID=A0AAQ3MBA7_9PEZI|nr:Hypothetical protein R9X50_00462400 [Acrodontium crateriforme]
MRRQPHRSLHVASRAAAPPSDPLTLIRSYDVSLNPSKPIKSSPLGSSTIAGLPLELLDRLKAFPLFQTAPESFLLSIGKSLRPSVYQPSQEIITEGEDAKAMYWLVRGSVKVISRDGESTYAELKPGAFFGEIGIIMDMPRTASIAANTRSLVVRLNKEDLQKELPKYPDVERSIREEAVERLAILERKKKGQRTTVTVASGHMLPTAAPRKRSRDWNVGDVEMVEAGSLADGEIMTNKKRKSPSPGLADLAATSAIDHHPPLTVRQLLKELPLFSGLPSDILHFLGINAQPVSFPPFTEIIKQGSTGRDVFFIIKGDVEVLTDISDIRHDSAQGPTDKANGHQPGRQRFRARLKAGQYFGEVTSLSLAPRRTATVRSIISVECLLINGDVLDDLWRKCSPNLRDQVENEAKRRLSVAQRDEDVVMADAGLDGSYVGGHDTSSAKSSADQHDGDDEWKKGLPVVKFDQPLLDDQQPSSPSSQMEPIDPDPFFSAELDNVRARSRRSSLAPPVPGPDGQSSSLLGYQRTPSPPNLRLLSSSSFKSKLSSPATAPSSPLRLSPSVSRRASLDRVPSSCNRGKLTDKILEQVFQYLDIVELMRCRLVSTQWWDLLNNSPNILYNLDLSRHNRQVTDEVLRNTIVPFVGNRPKNIDISNCFHLTDDGFKALADACGEEAKIWKMKSVWDVTGTAILALVEKSKCLEEIDLSNCRKVGDNLLVRVVGWVVTENTNSLQPFAAHAHAQNRRRHGKRALPAPKEQEKQIPGTVIGALKLKRITLSYCKHVQDRSMAHIAAHAASRLESLDLTRCTSISDAGFHNWGVYDFKNLRKLILADCTYLSDQAIVGVVGGCRGLHELDLSFCCALSDTATEVLALGLPALRALNMAFCGSAISDNSLRCIGLHLLELRYLSVRGCVRVTGHGVESVVDGCRQLEEFDVSQCKNLRPWLESGGVKRINSRYHRSGKKVRFDVVADGTWRVNPR